MHKYKEFAKFACGAEAFHTLVHTYFALSGTNLTVLGIKQTLAVNAAGIALNAMIAIGLGVYAWRSPSHQNRPTA